MNPRSFPYGNPRGMAGWTGAATLMRRSSRNSHVCLNRHKPSPAAAQRRDARQHADSPRIDTWSPSARTESHGRSAGAAAALQPGIRSSCTIARPGSQKYESETGHICNTACDWRLPSTHVVVYILAPGEVLGNEQATPSPRHDTIRKRTKPVCARSQPHYPDSAGGGVDVDTRGCSTALQRGNRAVRVPRAQLGWNSRGAAAPARCALRLHAGARPSRHAVALCR